MLNKKTKWCCSTDSSDYKENGRSLNIELPEIIGQLKPTIINTSEDTDCNKCDEYDIFSRSCV